MPKTMDIEAKIVGMKLIDKGKIKGT